MNTISQASIGLALATLSASALAVDLPADRPNHFEYDYLEIAYSDLDYDLDGFALAFSHDIRNNIAITGQLLSASSNYRGADLDYDLFSIGAAYHFKSTEMTDTDVVFHGEIARSDGEAAAGGADLSEDDTGIRIGAKLRMNLQPGVEVFGDISLTTLDEAGDSNILVTPGVAYEFADGLAGYVSYEISDREWLSLGLRYYY